MVVDSTRVHICCHARLPRHAPKMMLTSMNTNTVQMMTRTRPAAFRGRTRVSRVARSSEADDAASSGGECPPSAVPGTTPHSDTTATPHPYGARTDAERIDMLGKAALDCGAIMFVKSHSGRYRCVNDTYLEMFGFSCLDEVLGKTDEELIETILAKPEHPIFHHSYRGEAITDLPEIWRENDESVLTMKRPRWFRERSPFVKDGRLHEFVIMKAPFEDGLVGVGVLDGV